MQFGRGIYCTDAAAKVALYGFTAVDRPGGFLILAVASLGEEAIEISRAPEVWIFYIYIHVVLIHVMAYILLN